MAYRVYKEGQTVSNPAVMLGVIIGAAFLFQSLAMQDALCADRKAAKQAIDPITDVNQVSEAEQIVDINPGNYHKKEDRKQQANTRVIKPNAGDKKELIETDCEYQKDENIGRDMKTEIRTQNTMRTQTYREK